eukprot:scaffold737_cov394-Pavlova_lutheri.AAC.1
MPKHFKSHFLRCKRRNPSRLRSSPNTCRTTLEAGSEEGCHPRENFGDNDTTTYASEEEGEAPMHDSMVYDSIQAGIFPIDETIVEDSDVNLSMTWLACNGIIRLHSVPGTLVHVVIGTARTTSLRPLGVCTIKQTRNRRMISYCTTPGCGGSHWYAIDMASEDDGCLCKCGEVLLKVYPTALDPIATNHASNLNIICEGFTGENLENCMTETNAPQQDTLLNAAEDESISRVGMAFSFQLERDGRTYFAVCCGMATNVFDWGLLQEYGGNRTCLTCSRGTSTCAHVRCLLKGLKVQSKGKDSNLVNKSVTRLIDQAMVLQSIARRRFAPNFLIDNIGANKDDILRTKELLCSIALDASNERNTLDMQSLQGVLTEATQCNSCNASVGYLAREPQMLLSETGFFYVKNAMLCKFCYTDPRMPQLCFVPWVSKTNSVLVHDVVFVTAELAMSWHGFSESNSSYTSLCSSFVKRVLYHSTKASLPKMTLNQLLHSVKRPFREAMQLLILGIDFSQIQPTNCPCMDRDGPRVIHIDGMVLGFRKDWSAFEHPWVKHKEGQLVIPHSRNYPSIEVRDILWKLGSSGVDGAQLEDALGKLRGPFKVLGYHVHECKPNRWVIATPLVGICQAIGSIYPLNTFIPPNAKVVLENYCKGDITEWTVGHIRDVSLESRHLGMAMHFLSKHGRGGHKNLRSLCAYLLGRLEKSSKAKDILELQVARTDTESIAKKHSEMEDLEFALRTGCIGPHGKFVRFGRYHGKSSTIRQEKDYKRSNEMVPGVVHYLCGTCSKVVGFHIIHGFDSESTVEIMEFLYAFFREPPSKVVYDNAKELQLVCASREAEFFAKTIFLQDQAHHKNHTTAPTHFCSSNDKCITNGPLSEQHNADVRLHQNTMMFSNQVGYMVITLAHVLMWNAKKNRGGNELLSSLCHM